MQTTFESKWGYFGFHFQLQSQLLDAILAIFHNKNEGVGSLNVIYSGQMELKIYIIKA